jgi:hypothetical protein
MEWKEDNSLLWDLDRFGERDRQGALCELRDWVNHVLVDRHHLGGLLPSCWWHHPPLVDMLVRLHEWEVFAAKDELALWRSSVNETLAEWSGPCQRHLPAATA